MLHKELEVGAVLRVSVSKRVENQGVLGSRCLRQGVRIQTQRALSWCTARGKAWVPTTKQSFCPERQTQNTSASPTLTLQFQSRAIASMTSEIFKNSLTTPGLALQGIYSLLLRIYKLLHHLLYLRVRDLQASLG